VPGRSAVIEVSSDAYKGTNGASGIFEYVSGSPDT
jgi:hypothetical protein